MVTPQLPSDGDFLNLKRLSFLSRHPGKEPPHELSLLTKVVDFAKGAGFFAPMLKDSQYKQISFKLSEMEHKYGKNVHLLSDPFLFSTLARLCRSECQQPMITELLTRIYRELVGVVISNEFPLATQTITTRMKSYHPEGDFEAPVVDSKTKVVCVNLARAGTVPSQICFDAFNYILDPTGVRQDHISINRKVDDSQKVVGTNLGGVKIGGDVSDRYVVFPDPMGATGSTILTAMEIYSKLGKAKKYVAIHLVVTPEYLRKVTQMLPNLSVYAIRLDRGLSPKEILNTTPGEKWDKERGLNDRHYIVPGAGGLGELINNSDV